MGTMKQTWGHASQSLGKVRVDEIKKEEQMDILRKGKQK
jgi:hypothetical protein